jgi:hypothetical protein
MNGINIQPVDLEDLSADKVKSFVPQNLYRFLCLLVSNPDKIDGDSPAATHFRDSAGYHSRYFSWACQDPKACGNGNVCASYDGLKAAYNHAKSSWSLFIL